jgi:signal transduction histidine kinase
VIPAHANPAQAPTARRPRPLRLLAGAVLGTVVWPVDLVISAVSVAAGRPQRREGSPGGGRAAAVASRLVAWHRRRLIRWNGWADDGTPVPPGRTTAYLTSRVGVGILGTAMLALLGFGLYAAVAGLLSWLLDIRVTVSDPLAGGQVTTAAMLTFVPLGAVLLYLNLMGLAGVGVLDRAVADRWLAADRHERLARRVEELTLSRAELLAALDAERGRIERDLHDGVQQRAVALGLLVGRARRSAEAGSRTHELLGRAAAEAEHLLADLRDVAWRVRPTSLDTMGLASVLQQLVERTDPPTALRWDDPRRLPSHVETTVYYVVAEALTNVTKHARAPRAEVTVRVEGTGADARVTVVVTDDGVGGAGATGGHGGHGLAGLASRVAAAGGELTVASPPGGPTRLEAVIPCA